MRRLKQFLGLPPGRKRLFLEAAWLLVVARAAVFLVSFPRISQHLGELLPAATEGGSERNAHLVDTCAGDIAWAIATAAKALPIQIVCLPRALTAWHMMRRRGIAGQLHFGAVRREQNAISRLVTHAWVDASGVPVSGYPEAWNCVEIGFYVV